MNAVMNLDSGRMTYMIYLKVLDLPDEIINDNRHNVDKIDALRILPKRCPTHGDLVQRFGRAVP